MKISQLTKNHQACWMSPLALFHYDQMPDWTTLKQSGFLSTQDPKLQVFISHPWETPDSPDPLGQQWRVLQRVFRNALSPDNPSESSLHDPGAGYMGYFPSFLERYVHVLEAFVGSVRPYPAEVQYFYRSIEHSVSAESKYFFSSHLEMEPTDDKDARRFREEIGLWIDYCCLPQGRRNKSEEKYFQAMAPQICHLAASSTVLAIWPDEKLQQKRAWCLSEIAIHYSASGIYAVKPSRIIQFGKREIGVAERGNTILFTGLSKLTNKSVNRLASKARQARHPDEILSWFKENDIRCSNEKDLYILANAVFASSISTSKLGTKVMIKAFIRDALGILSWPLALPSLITYPFAVVASKLVNHTLLDLEQRFGRRFPVNILYFLVLFVTVFPYGFIYIFAGFQAAILLGPIEYLRRRMHISILRSRSAYLHHIMKVLSPR